ncbi:MAG: pyruvate kinase [Lachnospiraceae bacterium]|nr:pyruvate kinase [Lachnospiraceae bacterium]
MEIFGTLGPACSDEKTIYEMMRQGMTGMRINLSHTDLAGGNSLIDSFTVARASSGGGCDLLIDLQGPELRIGKIAHALSLQDGDEAKIPVPSTLASLLVPGQTVLLDDGKLSARVLSVERHMDDPAKPRYDAVVHILRGGLLKGSKSLKIEGMDTDLPTLTSRDKRNLAVASDLGVTTVMLPFVRGADDIKALRENIGDRFRIFAKIENMVGVEHVDEIIAELDHDRDMLVIARGDLGNNMPLWELPRIQKQLEAACHKSDMPYMIVTELLASMVQNPAPTRAEVSDVYHAIYHGASAIMVTNETAEGKYPVDVIRYMKNIADTLKE